jgi:hypothetical protein
MDSPLTISRQRPNLYRFDHQLFEAPAVLACDGQRAWIQSAAFGAPAGREITEDWKRNVLEDAVFTSPLLEQAGGTAQLELIGQEQVEGALAWKIQVTPAGGSPEIWYLDAVTFLEAKRVSRTYDVFSGGVEIEMESFFMDFRPVGGVVIPFREERHFGTRYHVYQAESAEVNPALDAALFALPPPPPEGGDGAAAGG